MVIDKSIKEIRAIEDTEEATREAQNSLRIPFGVQALRSAYGNKDIDLTPSQVIQCLCHLDPNKMVEILARINRATMTNLYATNIAESGLGMGIAITIDKMHPKEPVKVASMPSSDHAPCSCGSTDFRRTGTCFVCLTCGSSQGCS